MISLISKCFGYFVLYMVIPLSIIGSEPVTLSMEAFLWKNRPVIIFVNSDKNGNYQNLQDQLNSEREQILDRDITVLHLFSEGESYFESKSITKESVQQIRNRFNPSPNELVVILVGKDGTEKARLSGKVDITRFFPIIDAMPMRRQEMQKRTPDR